MRSLCRGGKSGRTELGARLPRIHAAAKRVCYPPGEWPFIQSACAEAAAIGQVNQPRYRQRMLHLDVIRCRWTAHLFEGHA